MKAKLQKLSNKLMAAAVVGTSLGTATEAFAAKGFSNIVDTVATESNTIPNLVTIVSYVAGLGLSVFGIFKLREHVDNPGQVKMKDGLVRLGAGGMLLVLPFLLETVFASVGGAAGGGVAFEKADVMTF